MSILVTGACGFIGSWTVRRLLEMGEKVILTDVSSDMSRLKQVLGDMRELPFVVGDIVEEGFVDEIVRKYSVESIIHLAAFQIPQCRANPVKGAMVNVVGTLRVFEAAKNNRETVERVVYASSAAVFGPPELYGEGPVPPNVILKPTTHYGAYKVCNELTANAYWHESGIPSVGLRPQVVYGVGRDVGVTSDVARAIKASVVRRPFKIRFGGLIDLQYVEDVAHLFAVAALRKIDGARVYNVRGEVLSVPELISLIEDVTGAKGLITLDDKPLPIPASLDDSETMRDLGPLRKTSAREGIAKTADHFRLLLKRGDLDISDLA